MGKSGMNLLNENYKNNTMSMCDDDSGMTSIDDNNNQKQIHNNKINDNNLIFNEDKLKSYYDKNKEDDIEDENRIISRINSQIIDDEIETIVRQKSKE